jgi:2-desacetyl-2-hydroxyethyl bacteriochlorophyllide A dehydrogenase
MPERRTVYFCGPGRVELRLEERPAPGQGELLVETQVSAISAGTEMLVYRGRFPPGLSADSLLPGLEASFAYPIAYGYAAVGIVIQTGAGVDGSWLGRQVFSFQPHTSHFLAAPEAVLPVPEGIPAEAACFLPNTETAVNLAQDGAPILGERVLVLGQGIVGLLTAALLREFPLEALVTADCHIRRRQASLSLGVADSLEAGTPGFQERLRSVLPAGADLTYELSGDPAALDEAIAATGFSGRIVIGSWYGEKRAELRLGEGFHRSRIRLISSQVSTLAPELSGRWDKRRRFQVAWSALGRIRPERWISHRLPLEGAHEAYRLLDESPAEALQVILVHK